MPSSIARLGLKLVTSIIAMGFFFDWIDSKGKAAGAPLPNLAECPHSQLDSDTILYRTNPEIQEHYALSVNMGKDSIA
eukprot:3195861-Ditylum_brightwellii.AAC.2